MYMMISKSRIKSFDFKSLALFDIREWTKTLWESLLEWNGVKRSIQSDKEITMKKSIAFICILTGISLIPIMGALAQAVDMEILEGESALYILYEDGSLVTAGAAVNLGAPQGVKAVDLTLTPSGQGYYILSADGTIYSFGDAVQFGQPAVSSQNHQFVDMEINEDSNGFYFLRNDGSIAAIGEAVFYGELLKANAVDLELAGDEKGYYVLYQDGTIAFFGSALNRGFTQTQSQQAVDLEITDNGYYTLTQDGDLQTYGSAVLLPDASALSGDLVDMTLTSRGYRTLDSNGQTQSFFRLDNQGSISFFAASTVVKPMATATPTPVPSSDEAYFSFTDSGFTEKIIGRLPVGTHIPSGMTTGQASVSDGDLFLAVAPADQEAARIILHYGVEDINNSSRTGSIFARLTSERGEAAIRGISYNPIGMMVTVEDAEETVLILIEGAFATNAVNDFQSYQ